MPNFRIIEGDDLFETVQKEFIELYNKGVKVKDIQARLGLTQSQYMNFLRRLRRSGDITTVRAPWAGQRKEPRDHPKKYPKNYSFNHCNRAWSVTHCETYYTYFKSEREAKRFVELMRECDWDKSRTEELRGIVLNGG